MVIRANTNYNNEHIFWDNSRVSPPVLFRRGDCDGSGAVDIADALRALVWLFSDATTPGCLEACDANDDGKVALADAVFTLSWLFRGGTAPPVPGPFACDLETARPHRASPAKATARASERRGRRM